IWGEDCSEIVPVSVLRAAPRLGGVVAGAFDEESMLQGMVFGLTGIDSDGRPLHWSDMLAVRPALQNRGLGERLKRWQRDAVLPLGVRHVLWTFDPLEAKNAYLNVSRLGVVATEYIRDYYGDTASPLHSGAPTDRLVADWRVASDRVRRRLARETRPPTASEVVSLPAALDARVESGVPRPAAGEPTGNASPVRIAVPSEIQALKVAEPRLVAEWRAATRLAFEACFGRGLRIEEVVRAGDVAHYVLGVDAD
ncbi:MAG: hypothetical protein ACRELV_02970, partial [Longimicrobiales bacterium]